MDNQVNLNCFILVSVDLETWRQTVLEMN